MPIYAYKCESCGFAKDVLQKISDPHLSDCPQCGKAAFQKQVTAAGFQLKGSGWYVTDFRGGDTAKAPAAGAVAGAGAEASTTPATSDSSAASASSSDSSASVAASPAPAAAAAASTPVSVPSASTSPSP
ncbi:MAG: zinc ribbon domain-containing protein [Comamonadaceae bacterium]|nr:MAG: zinc ribbon domain-containing protein [Comamonadaceae bacterium]